MSIIGEAFILVKEQLDPNFGSNLESSAAAAAAGIDKNLSTKVTAASAALAGLTGLMFSEFDKGADAIVGSSGRSGAALDELQESMKNVAGEVTSSIGVVGQTMADLARQTDLTGDPLERLTEQIVEMSEIGPDAAIAVGTAVDVFKSWQVETGAQSALLDELFRASKVAGTTVEGLSSSLVRNRDVLGLLNLGLADSIALLGGIEREGLNADAVLRVLRLALVRLGQTTDDPNKALEQLIDRMENAGTQAEALDIAVEAIGTRSGPVLAEAVRRGVFEFESFEEVLRNAGEGVDETRAKQDDLSDSIARMRNQIIATVGDTAQWASSFFTIAAGVAPMARGLQAAGAAAAAIGGRVSQAATAGMAAMTAAAGTATAALAALAAVAVAVGVAVLAWKAAYDAWQTANAEHQKSVDASSTLLEAYAKNVALNIHSQEDWKRMVEAVTNEEGLSAEEKEKLRGEAELLTRSIEDGTLATKASAEQTRRENQEIRESTIALQENRLARLALAGGLLGVQAAAFSAADAEDALAETRERLDRLTRRGKEGTEKYRDALRDNREAVVQALESQLSLESATAEYIKSLNEKGAPSQQRINSILRDAAREAGVTAGEFGHFRDRVLDLVGALDKVPAKKEVGITVPGLAEARNAVQGLKADLDRLPAAAAIRLDITESVTRTRGDRG